MSNQITATRYLNNFDVFFKNQNTLQHHWKKSIQDQHFESRQIHSTINSNCACIRNENNIDIYFVSTNDELIHLKLNADAPEIIHEQKLLENVLNVNPAAVRFQDDIDVYCVSKNNKIIHLWTSDQHQGQYKVQQLYSSENMGCLSALRAKKDSLDLFFFENHQLVRLYAGDHTEWKYQKKVCEIKKEISPSQIHSTRQKDDIDIFFVDSQGFICKFYTGAKNNWTFENGNRIGFGKCKTKDGKFSVVRLGQHTDVYYIGENNMVYHAYSGKNNNFKWDVPCQICQIQASSGITAVRPYQNSIDVFFSDKNNELKTTFIGQGTDNDWSYYHGFKIDFHQNKEIIKLQQVLTSCQKLGEGYHGDTYKWEQKNLVLKIMKRPNPWIIRNEIQVLDKISQIDKVYRCQFQVTRNNKLVGLAMNFIEGAGINLILDDDENIFSQSKSSRVKLLRVLKEKVLQMQQIGVCHGDLLVGNVHCLQRNKQSDQFQMFIIDFGNSFLFGQNTLTDEYLTGVNFMKPPQSKTGKKFNPIGVNPYMLGRLSLQILLKESFRFYSKIKHDPGEQLQKIREQGYHQSVVNYIEKLVSDNINERLEAFYSKQRLLEQIYEAKREQKVKEG